MQEILEKKATNCYKECKKFLKIKQQIVKKKGTNS